MKLLDAMRVINQAASTEHTTKSYALICGFTPLALETFFRAELQQKRPDARVDVTLGLFGDLVGSLEKAMSTSPPPEGIAVVIEWSDLDPRLGYRSAAPIEAAGFADDVVAQVSMSLARLRQRINQVAATPLAICLPTLPLPPVFHTSAGRASPAGLRLRAELAAFGADLGAIRGVRVVDAALLDAASPPSERLDVKSELLHGFPYQRTHASAVAAALATLLAPAVPKKGIITDLDNTLWRGIVGEVGVTGVRWGLEQGAQLHALYQQCLAALAEAGVLVAIASKNDAAVVAEALRRDDLLLRNEHIFPVHASWGPKSAAVAAILDAWNVGADSVVFVDDSPLEIAEVQTRFPDIEGLRFDPEDAGSTLRLVARLRELFGRDEIRDEDRLRAASLRGAAELRAAAAEAVDDDNFLAGLDAELVFTLNRDVDDARAFELINKTNQFNLNGERSSPAEWAAALARPEAFLLTVSYRDKFGPLGKIGVACGTISDGEAHVDRWVMSCRAFSRRIEHQTVRTLLDVFGVQSVALRYAPTQRNGPLQEFLTGVTGVLPSAAATVRLDRDSFDQQSPVLHHRCTYEIRDVHAQTAQAGGG